MTSRPVRCGAELQTTRKERQRRRLLSRCSQSGEPDSLMKEFGRGRAPAAPPQPPQLPHLSSDKPRVHWLLPILKNGDYSPACTMVARYMQGKGEGSRPVKRDAEDSTPSVPFAFEYRCILYCRICTDPTNMYNGSSGCGARLKDRCSYHCLAHLQSRAIRRYPEGITSPTPSRLTHHGNSPTIQTVDSSNVDRHNVQR